MAARPSFQPHPTKPAAPSPRYQAPIHLAAQTGPDKAIAPQPQPANTPMALILDNQHRTEHIGTVQSPSESSTKTGQRGSRILQQEVSSPQNTTMGQGKPQPRSSGSPQDEVPRLGLLLATLMSERGLDRNETAHLCNVQPQTIKNALDDKSVNARLVLRLIEVFELRDRPEVLRNALISHLALQLGANWLEVLRRAQLVPQSALQRDFPSPLEPNDVELSDTLSTVMKTYHRQSSCSRAAMRRVFADCSRMSARKEHLGSTHPRVIRSLARGQRIASTSPTIVHGATIWNRVHHLDDRRPSPQNLIPSPPCRETDTTSRRLHASLRSTVMAR